MLSSSSTPLTVAAASLDLGGGGGGELVLDPPRPLRVGEHRAGPDRRPGDGLRHRQFDPERISVLEARAWAAYYRREWLRFAVAGMVCARRVFGLSWVETVVCSWLVLRANQVWSPYPANDVPGAQRRMVRFYRLLARRYGTPTDPDRTAELDIEWWRVHREIQRGERPDGPVLAQAIARFWAAVYGVPAAALADAAAGRARAMRLSDRWVEEGCDLESPLREEILGALVTSYAGLLAAVAPA